MANSPESGGFELTFAQREREAPLSEPMQLEHIPKKFRQLAWAHLAAAIETETDHIDCTRGDYGTQAPIGKIVSQYQFHIQGKFHDEVDSNFDSIKDFARDIICHSQYRDTLKFVVWVMQHTECSSKLRNALIETFKVTPIAYVLVERQKRLIVVPRINRETGEAAIQALETLHETGMNSAEAHLHQASRHINAKEYSDSMVDSIHAVESVARNVDPDSSKTLGLALDSLENVGLLQHHALKEAFKNLYGYTSDEQGLRHALIDRTSPNVGLDEAIFMFGACASFAAYLTSKHRQMQDGNNGDS